MSPAEEMISAASEVLQKGIPLLEGISREDYSAKVPEAFDASIGAHFRHCLDHFQNLLDSLDSGSVDYDARQRDPLIESDPSAALAKTRELLDRLNRLGGELPSTIQVRCKVSYEAGHISSIPSTPARELMFCVSHAIHHHAMVRMIANIRGIPWHGTLGIAPSTVAHRAQTSCATGG